MTTDSTAALVDEIREAGRLDQAGFEKRLSELEAEHGMDAMSAAFAQLHEIGARQAANRPAVFESDDNGMRGATDDQLRRA